MSLSVFNTLQSLKASKLTFEASNICQAWLNQASGVSTVSLKLSICTLNYANARHTGEQLVASPAPQARCAGACYGFQVLLVREACSTSSAFIKAEIIAR